MAKQTWWVRGYLKVKEKDTTGAWVTRPLDNVEVRLEGSQISASMGFKEWGTTHTNDKGFFKIAAEKDKSGRHLKLECRFKDSGLEIGRPWANALATGGLDGNYNTIWRSGSKTKKHEHGLGTLCFESGGKEDLGNSDVRKHATWWFALKELKAALRSKGSWYDFNGRIHVAYPEAVLSGTSWAEDITTTAHIMKNSKKDHGNLSTVFHEVMHLWNYHHNVGTSNWAAAVCGDFNTHGHQENPNIAFHEGFAEFAGQAMLRELFGEPDEPTLVNGPSLKTKGLNTLAMVERNDYGVECCLRALTGDVNPARLDVWDVFETFKANASKGWPKEWEVGNSDYGVLRFFAKAADIHPTFARWKQPLIDYLDPQGDGSEPRIMRSPVPEDRTMRSPAPDGRVMRSPTSTVKKTGTKKATAKKTGTKKATAKTGTKKATAK